MTPSLRQVEGALKGGAPGHICFCPELSFVSFDNRAADRQPHAQALRLSRIEGVEKTIKTLLVPVGKASRLTLRSTKGERDSCY
jgi:hypothetical protein